MATNAEIKSFIQTFGALAVNECNRRIASGLPFILPSVCMAQSALETGWGTSGLMTKANAFFGVKAGGSWTGKIYVADTWEVAANGEIYNTVANFRAYNSKEEGLSDYYELTCTASRYSKALSYGSDRSKWLTARATITALWAGGYATDSLYVEKIMNTINGRNLTEWDTKITGEGEFFAGDYAFSATDFTQGKIIAADSGRAFGIAEDTNAVALKVDKAITNTATSGETPFYLGFNNLPEGVITTVAIQNNDAITFHILSGNSINIPAGASFAFYFHRTSDDITKPPTLSVTEFADTTFSVSSVPNNSEVVRSALAFFVEIK